MDEVSPAMAGGTSAAIVTSEVNGATTQASDSSAGERSQPFFTVSRKAFGIMWVAGASTAFLLLQFSSL